MQFLENTNDYNETYLLELCKKKNLYKEAAFILEKHNRKDEVLTTLIDELNAFEEAVKYIVKYHPDDH